MQIIVHRVNDFKKLAMIDPRYGVEIDIRADRNKLILNHEPFSSGPELEEYLKVASNQGIKFVILNTKETGIEEQCIELVRKYKMDYFLLDVEAPYIYKAAQPGIHRQRKIAIRYSEYEPIENVQQFKDIFDWVWIDTATQLPLNKKVVPILNQYKTCLVCPERWSRAQDIIPYRKKMMTLEFTPTAVMTSLDYIHLWEQKI
jgi:hypothetical protein